MRAFLLLRALAGVALAANAAAQRPAPATTPVAARDSFAFTIENMMRGPEVVGRPPMGVRWTPDNQWIYFRWVEPGTDWREELKWYRVRPQAGARPERMSTAQMDTILPALVDGDVSRDRLARAVEHDGDIYVVDLRRGTTRRLTETLERETSPKF